MIPLLATLASTIQVDENITLYPLIPADAVQGWNLELCELYSPASIRHEKTHPQIIIVANGALSVASGGHAPVLLREKELSHLNADISHRLTPEGTVRYFTIDFPADVSSVLPLIDLKYFGAKIDKGDYTVYEIVSGNVTDQKWSAALLDIQDSPRHYHRIETEHFVVVNGELDIEIDGLHQIFRAGESVVLYPGMVHSLKSATQEPVRVLCFNFPAFDQSDHYLH